MKKAILFSLTVVLCVAIFTSCTQKNEDNSQAVQLTYEEFIGSGKRIAVQIGEVYGDVAQDIFKAQAQEYNSPADMLESLRAGRTDAALLDSTYIQPLIDSGSYPDMDYLWIPKEIFSNESAAAFASEELRDKYNEWLAIITADGTLDEIKNRWIGVPLPDDADVPKFELTGENGVLRVVDTGNYPPFTYMDSSGKPTGFDFEMVSRFAQHLGMDLEITFMSYDAILPYIFSNRADMSACLFTITEERVQGVIFGDPVIASQGVLVLPHSAGSTDSSGLVTYTDFAGKRVGVPTGSVCDQVTEVIGGIPVYYSEMSAGIEDIRRGRISGYMNDHSAVRIAAAMPGNEDLFAIQVPAEFFVAPMGALSVNQDIIDRFNAFLATIKADGTMDEMQARWLDTVPDLDSPMPDIPSAARDNGKITVASTGTMMPFAYMGTGGVLKGYSIELALRFAAHEGLEIEFAEMDFSGLIPHVISGKSDFAIANVSITEERKQSVIFSDSIFDDTLGIIFQRPESGASSGETGVGFFEWLKTGIERNLITDNRWKMLADGLAVTMQIAFFAMLFGTIFGSFICWVLTRKNKFINWLGRFYCGFIHGTPIVVLLMITYYIIFGGTRISNVVIAIAAFTMVMGANVAQNLKGAIDTIDPVEIEAARSLGFSAFKAFLTVTLPQAVRRALPGYTNGFVELVKATAIVGYVAIQDMMRAADIIRSRTFDAFFPLLFVAVIYLLITTVCVQLFKLVMRKAGVSQ